MELGLFETPTLIDAAFTNSGVDSTGANWTVGSLNFGTADANRWLYAAVTLTANSTINDISSVKIGGITATEVVYTKAATSASWGLYAGIWKANVPTGTSGSVFVSFSGGSGVTNGCSASIYRIIKVGTLSETTDTDNETTVETIDLAIASKPWNFTIVAAVGDRSAGAPTITFDTVTRNTHRTENTTRHAHGSAYGVGNIIATTTTTQGTLFVGASINDSG